MEYNLGVFSIFGGRGGVGYRNFYGIFLIFFGKKIFFER